MDRAMSDETIRDLSFGEAAQMLGVSERTIKRIVKRGKLDAYPLTGNGSWRVVRQSLRDYIAEVRQNTA